MYSTRIFIFQLILFFSVLPVLGQPRINKDSLYAEIERKDLINVEAYEKLLAHYAKNEPERLFLLSKELLERAVKEGDEPAEMIAYFYIADYHSERGNHKLALENLHRARKYYEKHESRKDLVDAYNGIGNVHFRRGEVREAISWYLKSMNEGSELEDIWMSNLAKLNLGRSYIQIKDTLKGEALILDYIKEVRELDRTTELANAYNVLGGYYQGIGDFELADYYFNEALVISMTNGDKRNVAHSYNNLAISYFFQEKEELSKAYFQKALKSRLEIGNLLHIAESYYNLGDWFFFQGMLDSASVYYHKSYDVGVEADSYSSKADALMALTEVEKQRKGFDKALDYYEEYVDLKEQQFLSATQEDIAALEFDRMMSENKKDKAFLRHSQKSEERYFSAEVRNKWLILFSIAALTIIIIVLLVRLINEKKSAERSKQILMNRQEQLTKTFEESLAGIKKEAARKYDLLFANDPVERFSDTRLYALGDERLAITRQLRISPDRVFCWMGEQDELTSLLFLRFLQKNSSRLADPDNIDEVLMEQSLIDRCGVAWFFYNTEEKKVEMSSGVIFCKNGRVISREDSVEGDYLITDRETWERNGEIVQKLEQGVLQLKDFSHEMINNSAKDLLSASVLEKNVLFFLKGEE